MELEALQLPESNLQVLDLDPPVSTPDQVVSRQRRGGQSLLGGVLQCSKRLLPAGPTAHPVTLATQEAKAEGSQTSGLLELCNKTLSWNKKQKGQLGHI